MAALLVFTCMVTPYRIAFSEDDLLWICINYTVDLLFFTDIIVIFFTINLIYCASSPKYFGFLSAGETQGVVQGLGGN